MNRRQKKKVEKISRAKLHRILDQILDINGLESRQKQMSAHMSRQARALWKLTNYIVTEKRDL